MKNKIISLMLLCTVFTMYSAPIFATTKEETVYSKLNTSGENYKTIVSTKLKNDKQETLLEDVSNLINILNTNGDETFNQNGDSITWQANGNDIYYQGECTKSLPIECTTTYELNGKQIPPEEIVGKSGTVKVILKYTNKKAHKVNINGSYDTLYTPFIVIAGTSIENSKGKNISISKGKIINDGTKNIAIGMAMPGLQESLNISNDNITFPDSIEITMDSDSFEMGNIITFVSAKLLDINDLDLFNNLDSIYNKVSTLQDSSNKILDGTNSLSTGTANVLNGVDTLKNYMNTATNGTNEIKNQVVSSTSKLQSDTSEAIDNTTLNQIENQAIQSSTLTAEQKQLIESQATNNSILSNAQKQAIEDEAANNSILSDAQKQAIADEAANNSILSTTQKDEIANNAEQAVISSSQYQNLTPEDQQTIGAMLIQTARNSAIATAQNIATATAKQTAVTTAQKIATSTAKQIAVATAQNTATSTAKQVALATAQSTATSTAKQTAVTTAKQVANSAKSQFTSQTISQLNELSKGLSDLSDGMSKINIGMNDLYSGTSSLNNGMISLSENFDTFNREGIQTLCNYINGDVKDLTTRLEKLSKLSDDYNNFTMINKNTSGSVKFIMISDSLKKTINQEAILTDENKNY